MARRPLSERNIRKLSRHTRGTIFVSLPKEFIDELGWRSKQKVVVEKIDNQLVIKDWKK